MFKCNTPPFFQQVHCTATNYLSSSFQDTRILRNEHDIESQNNQPKLQFEKKSIRLKYFKTRQAYVLTDIPSIADSAIIVNNKIIKHVDGESFILFVCFMNLILRFLICIGFGMISGLFKLV